MTAQTRPKSRCDGVDAIAGIFFTFWFVLIVYIHLQTESDLSFGELNRQALQSAHPLEGLPGGRKNKKRSRRLIIPKTPLNLTEIETFLSNWLTDLHKHLSQYKKSKAEGIWDAFHNFTFNTLYPWDQEYLRRMPKRRKDGSIFLSVASYRDENCMSTLEEAYRKAKNPEKLFVGLVQQNCLKDCRTGILENGKSAPTDPDPDCHQLFCASEIGKPHCDAGRVRVLHVEEPESLGPYMARYFASKLWNGESWYMQIDSHMTYHQDWDEISLEGLKKAPSEKPILSHYPPAHTQDLNKFEHSPASRICDRVITAESIRMEGSSVWDSKKLDIPRFAPFIGAGYFVAHSAFLKDVPYDPFLPWIFMGEEIILSSRLWTSGYDIFSPAQAVVGHIYFRRHKPKFWESVHRAFTPGVHNPLEELILERIKYQLGFPEASRDMIPKNLLTAVEQYSMGTTRPLGTYMKIIGMNATTKELTEMDWCKNGQPPPGFEEFAPLYTNSQP